jgi:hypothetical protein
MPWREEYDPSLKERLASVFRLAQQSRFWLCFCFIYSWEFHFLEPAAFTWCG